MKKYLLLIFIGLAIIALILITKQREHFNPYFFNQPAPDYQGEINGLQRDINGLTTRVNKLEKDEQDSKDQTNQAIGGIQMVSKS